MKVTVLPVGIGTLGVPGLSAVHVPPRVAGCIPPFNPQPGQLGVGVRPSIHLLLPLLQLIQPTTSEPQEKPDLTCVHGLNTGPSTLAPLSASLTQPSQPSLAVSFCFLPVRKRAQPVIAPLLMFMVAAAVPGQPVRSVGLKLSQPTLDDQA